MYIRAVPTRLVMCDMLEGSVERIVRSNWLLGLLERLRVLPMILQRRQQSYTVVTQVHMYTTRLSSLVGL